MDGWQGPARRAVLCKPSRFTQNDQLDQLCGITNFPTWHILQTVSIASRKKHLVSDAKARSHPPCPVASMRGHNGTLIAPLHAPKRAGAAQAHVAVSQDQEVGPEPRVLTGSQVFLSCPRSQARGLSPLSHAVLRSPARGAGEELRGS